MQEAPTTLVTGTRVFGKFEPDKYDPYLTPFIDNAGQFGPVVIVSQYSYPNLVELKDFVAQSSRPDRNVQLRLSDTEGAQSPANMCNHIIKAGVDINADFFALVSSDLAEYIPDRFSTMLDRIKTNRALASIGVAIQGVHDLALLEEVRQQGMGAIRTDNYATLFHNNSFAIHRMRPMVNGGVLSIGERLFPRITDQEKLGLVEINGQQVPVGGNEEIALALELLRQNKKINTLLLDGPHTIIRDPNKEISSVDAKILRRPLVARVYQEHYGLSDEEVNRYLQEHYAIAFS